MALESVGRKVTDVMPVICASARQDHDLEAIHDVSLDVIPVICADARQEHDHFATSLKGTDGMDFDVLA